LSNGAYYNLEVGDGKYFVQSMWDPISQACEMSGFTYPPDNCPGNFTYDSSDEDSDHDDSDDESSDE
jgi:hypothetical protein